MSASSSIKFKFNLVHHQKQRDILGFSSQEIIFRGISGISPDPDFASANRSQDRIMEPQVYIVGPSKLQNELMAWFLENTSELTCACNQKTEHPLFVNKKTDHKYLILWDCQNTDPNDIWTELNMCPMKNDHCFVALFNAISDQGLIEEIVKRNIQGVFFEHDSLYSFTKGVQTILNGKLWFSREMMTKCLLCQKNSFDFGNHTQALLTTREKEILIVIASGSTNSEIADSLSISAHTVKTHLYNIFKKINVSNRVQASFWAAENL